MDVTFAGDRMHFTAYDLVGSTVCPAGIVTAEQIRDVDSSGAPPEVRTTRGETLFVPAPQAAELKEFCHRNGIAERRRPDIWADLLEPFIDTTYDAEHQQATLARLGQAGAKPRLVSKIRRRLTPLMRAYNFDSGLWDWNHLGLYDLLSAASGELVPPDLPARLGDLEAFYWWTMDIAEGRFTRW